MGVDAVNWLSEEDLALIDALHVNGRASFEQLGRALDVSPVTAARRWRRLQQSGQAWVSSVPGPALRVAGALVDIDCDWTTVQEVAQALTPIPQVVSLHSTMNRAAMYALVLADEPSRLAPIVSHGLATVPGVRSVSVAPLARLFGGWSWTLRALSREQSTLVSDRMRALHAPETSVLTAQERELFLALQEDGRASFRTIAERIGTTERSARQLTQHSIGAGRIALRTDFVRPGGGWPVQVALRLRVPDARVEEIGRSIAGIAEARVCAAVVAASNMFVTVQLHDVGALSTTIAQIVDHDPAIVIDNRELVLQTYKSWGRLIDAEGRSHSVVPVNPWAPLPDPAH